MADVNVSDPPSCCGSNLLPGYFPTILWRGALHPLTPSTPRDSSSIRVIAPLGWPNSTHETNDTVGGFGCFLTVKYNTPRARGVWCVFSTSKVFLSNLCVHARLLFLHPLLFPDSFSCASKCVSSQNNPVGAALSPLPRMIVMDGVR